MEGRWRGSVEAALKPNDSAEDEIVVLSARSKVQGLFGVEEAS